MHGKNNKQINTNLINFRNKIKQMLSNNYYKNNFDIAAQEDEDASKIIERLKFKRLTHRFPVSDIIVKDLDFFQRLLSYRDERTAACRSLSNNKV